jgi:hypothetical protein
MGICPRKSFRTRLTSHGVFVKTRMMSGRLTAYLFGDRDLYIRGRNPGGSRILTEIVRRRPFRTALVRRTGNRPSLNAPGGAGKTV